MTAASQLVLSVRTSLTIAAFASGVVALLAAPVAAQGGGITTATPIGVFAKDDNLADLQLIPARTAIAAPMSVQAQAGGGMASTAITPMRQHDRGVVVVEKAVAANSTSRGSVVAGTTDSTELRNAQPSAHSLLLRLVPPRQEPLRGALVVKLTGLADAGARAGAAVDIGDDGSNEFTQLVDGRPHEQKFRINAAAGGVSVKITTSGLVQIGSQGRTGYALELAVEFVEDDPGCTFTPYGPSCGPRLVGSDEVVGRLHSFTFEQSGAFPSSPGVLMLGLRPAQGRIPGTQCALLVDPIVIVPFSSDAMGHAILKFGVLGPISGDVYAQGVSYTLLPGFRLETSQGLRVSCP